MSDKRQKLTIISSVYPTLYPPSHYEKILWNSKDPKYKNPPLKSRLGRGSQYAESRSRSTEEWYVKFEVDLTYRLPHPQSLSTLYSSEIVL